MDQACQRVGLLVADTGGHLEELVRLEPRFRPRFDRVIFVTARSHQSAPLLQGREVSFQRRVPPRGVASAARSLRPAADLIRRNGVTDVISTGAAVALPYMMAATVMGARAHYIESAARTDGPSLTGALLRFLPKVRLYAQHETWAGESWRYEGTVFDGFRAEGSPQPVRLARRVVVTLGTQGQYPFHRAVAAVRRVLPSVAAQDCEILWQVGEAAAPGLPGDVRATVPGPELWKAIAEADLVFAHAGTGSSLRILDAGRSPVLLPRSQAFGEHVDGHQAQIAAALHRRGLAVSVDPDDLTPRDAFIAMARRIENRSVDATAFPLWDAVPA